MLAIIPLDRNYITVLSDKKTLDFFDRVFRLESNIKAAKNSGALTKPTNGNLKKLHLSQADEDFNRIKTEMLEAKQAHGADKKLLMEIPGDDEHYELDEEVREIVDSALEANETLVKNAKEAVNSIGKANKAILNKLLKALS